MSAVADLAKDLRLRLDANALAEHCGYDLDPWQRELVQSPAKQVLIAAARQVGKTLACGVVAAHEALRLPDGLVVVVSPSQRQSTELFRGVVDLIRKAKLETITAESSMRCELGNGSRVVALPGSSQTIRGLSGARAIIVDESAFVPDELYAAVMPMAATSDGRLILASSPAGTLGYFAKQWRDGGDVWERLRVRADQCSRISPEFLERQKLMLTDMQYRAEFLAEFVEGAGAVFRVDDLARLQTEAVESWEV